MIEYGGSSMQELITFGYPSESWRVVYHTLPGWPEPETYTNFNDAYNYLDGKYGPLADVYFYCDDTGVSAEELLGNVRNSPCSRGIIAVPKTTTKPISIGVIQ